MLVFDKAYSEIKNNYIVPLTKHNVQYRSLKHMNIKTVLLSKFRNVDDLGNGEYYIYFEEDFLVKALIGDIELFYIRAILQKEDFNCMLDGAVSSNWNIVTNYYSSFFYASLLLRICHRGNLFLEADVKKQLGILMSHVIGNGISLESNLFYEIVTINGEYVMKLSPSTANTHEVVWKKLDELLGEFLLISRRNSEESIVLKSMKHINTKLNNTYPSQLRNRVNYQPLYGLEYLERKLYHMTNTDSWLKTIIDFDSKETVGNDNKIANVAVSYGRYIEIMCTKLIKEYYDIKGNGDGILRKINERKNGSVIIPDYPFVYDY